jgi:hypothetical protein
MRLVFAYFLVSVVPTTKIGHQTHFPAKPSFDQKSNLIIFSGTLNFFRLMMRSSYSITGRTGSSGTTVIFPLFDSPAEETSTTSNFSRIVRLFFYPVSICPLLTSCDKGVKTYHNLFSMIWAHPFFPAIWRHGQWRIQAIQVPREGTVITRDDWSPRRSGVCGEGSKGDGRSSTGVTCYRAGRSVFETMGITVFLESFPATYQYYTLLSLMIIYSYCFRLSSASRYLPSSPVPTTN